MVRKGGWERNWSREEQEATRPGWSRAGAGSGQSKNGTAWASVYAIVDGGNKTTLQQKKSSKRMGVRGGNGGQDAEHRRRGNKGLLQPAEFCPAAADTPPAKQSAGIPGRGFPGMPGTAPAPQFSHSAGNQRRGRQLDRGRQRVPSPTRIDAIDAYPDCNGVQFALVQYAGGRTDSTCLFNDWIWQVMMATGCVFSPCTIETTPSHSPLPPCQARAEPDMRWSLASTHCLPARRPP